LADVIIHACTFTGDGVVLRNDFIDMWMAKYGDNHADTNKFFDNLDPNRDHKITTHDIVDQLPELGRMYLGERIWVRLFSIKYTKNIYNLRLSDYFAFVVFVMGLHIH